jgi:type IX secretion system PorP/SprF family membrane protein
MRSLLLPLLAWSLLGHAQDLRLAQPQLMGTLLNPAAAGAEQGMHLAATQRKRMDRTLLKYQATALSVDAPLGDPTAAKARLRDRLAWGLVMKDERMGEPRMRTTEALLSLSYRLRVAQGTFLAAGFQVGAMNHWADLEDGAWASQYDGLAFDPSLSSGERFTQRPVLVPELGAGVHLVHRPTGARTKETRFLQAGVAVHHLTTPRFSLDRTAGQQLARRYSGYARARLGKDMAGWEPLLLVDLQGGAFTVRGGAMRIFALGGRQGFRTGDSEWSAGIGAMAASHGVGTLSAMLRWGRFGGQFNYDLALDQAQRQAYGSGIAELNLFATLERAKR